MSNKLIIRTVSNVNFPHFVHYMQYLYWAVDIAVNEPEKNVIIVEPNNKSRSIYCESFKKKVKEVLNIDFVDNYDNNKDEQEKKYVWATLPGGPEQTEKAGKFILNGETKEYIHFNWFPNNKSGEIKKIFLNNDNNSKIKIGLVNRKVNRVLINYKELVKRIKEQFNIEVEITYFEDKSFEYQIKFFNEHDIIISPHGAQLCSTPFLKENGLIIECVHEEWHPYYYFPGLSNTSNKYHAVICDDHSCFPQMWSDKWCDVRTGMSLNRKLNINVDVDKVLNVIAYFLFNKKLDSFDTYLY